MPLNPETGIYEQSQGNPFPQGVFGGALDVNNARISQNLVDESRSRRMLHDQMSELQVEDAGADLEQQAKDRQRINDQATREEGWRKWNEANPGADTETRLKQSLAYGVKDTTTLSNMVYHEGVIENKDDKLKADRSKEARLEVDDLFKQGFTGQEIADQLEPKYGAAGIAPQYWQKIRSYKQSPMTAATIAEKGTQSNANNARAARDRAKAAGGTAGPDMKKLQAEKDKLMVVVQSTTKLIESPTSVISPETVDVAKQRLSDAKNRLAEIDSKMKTLAPNPSLTPPPAKTDTVSATKAPPKFKPIPAPGKPEGKTGQAKLSDGTIVPAIVRGGNWVAAE